MIRIGVENVIANANIGIPIDMEEIALRPETEYDAANNRIAYILDGKHIRIHSTGSILCMSGARSEKSARESILRICAIAKFPIPKKIDIKRIITAVSFGKKISLDRIKTGKYNIVRENENCMTLRNGDNVHGRLYGTGKMTCSGTKLNGIVEMVMDIGEMLNVNA